MEIFDIREFKNNLRKKYRAIRLQMSPDEKREKDGLIYENIINSKFYKQAKTIICFVSTNIEIDTHRLINKAFKDKKNVAVPRCINENGIMRFYYIKSLNDLQIGKYNLLEPNPKKCKELKNYKNSICIVPGFSFDPQGYRLGFGKGYYDRFLSKYNEIKIGICYNNCICNRLPHGRFDVSVNYLFTEKYVKTINKDTKVTRRDKCKGCKKRILGGNYELKPKRREKKRS